MWIIFSISLILGVFIFLILIFLTSLEDHRTKFIIRKTMLHQEALQKRSWKLEMEKYLDVITYPKLLNRIVDERSVIWSGIQFTHQHFLQLWWVFCLLGVFEGFVFLLSGNDTFLRVMVSVFLILGNSCVPYLYLQYCILKRRRDIERSLPDYLDMLTLTVEAGFGFMPAIKRINDGFSGAMGQVMNDFLLQHELGFSKHDALKRLIRQVTSPDIQNFAAAIMLSDRLGTSLSRTVRIQASLMRTRRRQRAETQAQTAPIRIIPALVFFFLPSLLLIYLAPPIINFLIN